MKTVSYPTKDYDFQTYFKLEGFGNSSFYLFPDGSDLKADLCDYSEVDGRDYVTITQGEHVLIDGKQYVTVISSQTFPLVAARFIAVDDMPTFIMDGDGTLKINGHLLEYKGPVTDDDMHLPSGEFRLGRALRHAQLAGAIPDDCEYVLDAGGTFHKIDR